MYNSLTLDTRSCLTNLSFLQLQFPSVPIQFVHHLGRYLCTVGHICLHHAIPGSFITRTTSSTLYAGRHHLVYSMVDPRQHTRLLATPLSSFSSNRTPRRRGHHLTSSCLVEPSTNCLILGDRSRRPLVSLLFNPRSLGVYSATRTSSHGGHFHAFAPLLPHKPPPWHPKDTCVFANT